MQISDQVVSLDLAKRLAELDVKGNSLFWWLFNSHSKEHYIWYNSCNYPELAISGYSAFTSAELGEMLPPRSYSFRVDNEHKWECTIDLLNEDYYKTSGGDTEADARARLLIHLIEQGMIEVGK